MTRSGQHLLQMLVNLLARQFGVVSDIYLDVPACTLHDNVILVPRINAGSLADGLVELGRRVSGGEIRIAAAASADQPTFVILVGPRLNPHDVPVPAIAVAGLGWRALVSTSGPLRISNRLSRNPLGPYLAACIAAGQGFKAGFSKQREVEGTYDLWKGDGEGPELDGLQLPTLYLIGLGAVGAALGFVLAAAEGVRGKVIGVDPQTMSETDRNRLLTGTWEDVGKLKAELLEVLFQGPDLKSYSFRGKWPDDYVGAPTRSLPPEARRREDEGKYDWVISCVDRNRDRVGIANYLPRHILGGSTYGMAAQTAYYSMHGPTECLACNHPVPRFEGVEQLAESARAMSKDERQRWFDDYGADVEMQKEIEKYLADPTCAGPGAADLARLGLQGRVDWAVGFVSVTAGLLLASRLIEAVIRGTDSLTTGGSEMRYLFWVDELDSRAAKRRPSCQTCGGEFAVEWNALWGKG
jgi:molybdopterin/thiamine biosynthesis adenylyltransferase